MDRNTHTDIVTNGKQQVTGIEQIIFDSIKDFNKIAGSEEFVLENVGRGNWTQYNDGVASDPQAWGEI